MLDLCRTAGLYFFDSLRSGDQVEVVRKFAYLQNTLTFPPLYVALYCIVLGYERMRVRPELLNGMYQPSTYTVMTLVFHLPLAFFIGGLTVFWMHVWGNLPWGGSTMYAWLVAAVLIWYCINAAAVIGWVLGGIDGQYLYMLGLTISYAVSGYFVQVESICPLTTPQSLPDRSDPTYLPT